MLRKPAAPLQQVVKRMSEKCVHSVSVPCIPFQKEHSNGPVPSHVCCCKQFAEYHQLNFKICLSLNMEDCCVLVDGKPGVVKNFLQSGSDCIVVYQTFKDVTALFTYPCKSDMFGIFRVSATLSDLCVAPVSLISQKCFLLKLPQGSCSAVIPLVHI